MYTLGLNAVLSKNTKLCDLWNLHQKSYVYMLQCSHILEEIKIDKTRQEQTCCNSLSTCCSCFIRCSSCSLARYSTGTTYCKGLSRVHAAHPGRVGELISVQTGHFQPAHITTTVWLTNTVAWTHIPCLPTLHVSTQLDWTLTGKGTETVKKIILVT